MSVIKVSTVYGNVIAKDLQLVDIHDVLPMEDEESINNSAVTADNQEESKSASESCCAFDTDGPTDEQ